MLGVTQSLTVAFVCLCTSHSGFIATATVTANPHYAKR